MNAPTLDIGVLKTWIGNSKSSTDAIRPGPVALMAATLGLKDGLLEDGAPLPAPWHWLYFLEATGRDALGRDGHAALGQFMPPVDLPRRMWAGGKFDFRAPLCIGESIRKVSTINHVERKSGRSGELCFVTVRHQFFAGDELRLSEDHDVVYCQDRQPGEDSPTPPLPPYEPDIIETVTPEPVLLFRYSALTFNSHRIHYDVDYCRDIEGYPGLVVHGPLTATLLLDLARRQAGAATLSDFSYRALSPLFHTHPFTIALRRDNNNLHVWATNPDGNMAMTASAHLSD